MSEGAHDPDKSALLRGTRASRRRARPFRAFVRFVCLLAFTAALLFGLALLVTRTAGFRELLARAVGKSLGTPVEIGDCALGPDMVLSLRGVRFPHPLPHAEGGIEELRLLPDWRRTRENRALTFGELVLRDVTLHVMETRLGTREPVALTRPMGLDTWKVRAAPRSDKPLSRRPPDTISPGPLPTLPVPTEEPAAAVTKPWRPWILRLADCRISVHKLRLVLHDEQGLEQAVFEDVRVEVDPGRGNGDPMERNARYRIDGKYRILSNHMPSQDLHLEWMNEDGTWILLRLEAERKLVFWVNRVLSGESAGPLAARDEAVPVADAPAPTPTPLQELSVLVGTNVLFQRETEETDPEEIKRMLREFLGDPPAPRP
jgi:hypothetical protein